MFPLHDRTRRQLCRWLFIVVGLLPTLGVVAWSASLSGTAHQAAICRDLSTRLGLDVRATRVSHPQPGITLLEGLELADPETGQTIVRMRLLEIEDDSEGRCLISASQPEIEIARLDRLWPVIDGLMRRADLQRRPLSFAAAELSFRSPAGVQTLTDFVARADADDDGTVTALSFQNAGESVELPVQLTLHRSTRAGQPLASFELDTHQVVLPCSLLTALARCENRLGPDSTFRGTISAGEAPDGWHTQITGQLAGVDLHAAISDQFPHQLGGIADITIRRADVVHGRLERLDGGVRAGPGLVSQSLLSAAAKWLAMPRDGDQTVGNGSPRDPEPGRSIVPYSQLAFEFTLDSSGLKVDGCCDADPGAILCAEDKILLREPAAGAVSLAALVNALAPDSRLPVPATRQSDWLLHVLPVPDATSDDARTAPSARLRHSDTRR